MIYKIVIELEVDADSYESAVNSTKELLFDNGDENFFDDMELYEPFNKVVKYIVKE